MPLRHPLRLRAVLLMDAIAWDAWILVMVLFNAMCLAFWRPTDASTSSLSLTIQFFEIFCQTCFTYEAIVKIVALGVVRYKGSYFRDPWSVFDFIVLLAGWLALYASVTADGVDASSGTIAGPLTVFGVIRVLRPFRILKMLPELRRLTGAVVLAVPQIATLMSLALLVFATLAVVGLNLLSGKLHQQCYKTRGNYYQDTGAALQLCTTSSDYGGGGRHCPEDFVCQDAPVGPNFGFTSFDNVGLAFLTIFQCMTQQGWADVMYWARQSVGYYMYAYFTVILFLSFFLFNLIIVFIIVNYSLSQEQSTVESIKDGSLAAPLVAVPSSASGSSSKSIVTPLTDQDEDDNDDYAGGLVPGSSTHSRRPSSDYSELLISKLLAIKAGAKLEALTKPPSSSSSETSPLLLKARQEEKNDGDQLDLGKQAHGPVSTKIAEIALLLQRAMRHLQLAPQNTLGPQYFRLQADGDDGEEDEDDVGGGRKGNRWQRKDPGKVTYEDSPGTFICAAVARSPAFYHFMNAMTLVSTILLSLAHYGMSVLMAQTLTRLNNLLVLVFTLEAFVKIRGLGWRRFKADGMNTFDLLVVVVSILELFLGGTSARSYALRCVRLLRVFSLARSWSSFRRVLFNMAYTASNSLPFLLLTTIFLSVFAIGGMTFLGGKLTETDPMTGLGVPVRANFDTFYWAVVSVFQIMTLDQWNENMYMAMAAADNAIAAGFYVLAVLFGKYVLLNLLTAILVENYSLLQADEDGRGALKRQTSSALGNLQSPFAFMRQYFPSSRRLAASASAPALPPPTQRKKEASDGAILGQAAKPAGNGLWGLVQRLRGRSSPTSSFLRVESLPAVMSTRDLMGETRKAPATTTTKKAAAAASEPGPSGAGGEEEAALQALPSVDEGEDDNIHLRKSGDTVALCHRCCLSSSSSCCHTLGAKLQALDAYFLRVYASPWFPVGMIVAILLSCVVLTLDCPGGAGLGPSGSFRTAVRVCEALFLCVATFEQVYRVKSLGEVWTYDGSYLTRMWDWFDLFVILTCLLALCIPYAPTPTGALYTATVATKVARGFRPITLIPRISGLTVVADTLWQALQACSGVLCVLAVFYLLFGILGVSLFSGGFYSCNDPERTCYGTDLSNTGTTAGGASGATASAATSSSSSSSGQSSWPLATALSCPSNQACTGKYYDLTTASMADRQWLNPRFSPEGSPFSFDNLPAALLSLFEVASLEMWGQIMYTACDVVGPGQAPVRNANSGAAVYFVCFLFIVCFFVQEIFVAVIIDNFKRLKRISNGSAFMTGQQEEWVRLQRTIKSRHPRIHRPPSASRQCLRYRVYKLVRHRFFEPFVTFLVTVNVCCMLVNHYPVSPQRFKFEYAVDSLFTFVYLAEALLRIAGLGLVGYLTSSRWNMYDAAITTWGVFVFSLGPIAQASVFCLLALRLGRTLRIFRIIRHSSHLRRLCRTFYFSLPSLKNIGMFLLLIYYIYAVGGMHLFSTLPFGTFINEDANFASFGLSLLTLIRCTAGESWNGLMHEADQATSHTRGKMAILYFCSFMILISYVALNLFIATMLENFQQEMAAGGLVTTKHVRTFSRLWTEYKKESLRGDLTKINNRTTKVTTPVMRRDVHTALKKRNKSLRHLEAGRGSSRNVATPSTGEASVGTPTSGSPSAAALAAVPSPSSAALDSPSAATGSAGSGGKRRVSLRERLGGALRVTSSAYIFKHGAGGNKSGETTPRKSLTVAAAAAEAEAPLGEDEESLIFVRLYESSPRYLPIQFLKTFVLQLPTPLGPKGCFEGQPITSARVLEYIRSLEVPVNEYAYVYYQDVLQAVLRRAFELQTHIPEGMRLPFKNKQVFLAHEWYAAVAVQSVWRGRSLRSKLKTTLRVTLRNSYSSSSASSPSAPSPVPPTDSPTAPNTSLRRSPMAASGQQHAHSPSSSHSPRAVSISVSIHEPLPLLPAPSPSHSHRRPLSMSSNTGLAAVATSEFNQQLTSGQRLSQAVAPAPREEMQQQQREVYEEQEEEEEEEDDLAPPPIREEDAVAKLRALQQLGEELLTSSYPMMPLAGEAVEGGVGTADEADLHLIEQELLQAFSRRQQQQLEQGEAKVEVEEKEEKATTVPPGEDDVVEVPAPEPPTL